MLLNATCTREDTKHMNIIMRYKYKHKITLLIIICILSIVWIHLKVKIYVWLYYKIKSVQKKDLKKDTMEVRMQDAFVRALKRFPNWNQESLKQNITIRLVRDEWILIKKPATMW